MSKRPLIQRRVDELETLFAASVADLVALKELEFELTFRQVPRAVSLLMKVRARLNGKVPQPAIVQESLFAPEPRQMAEPGMPQISTPARETSLVPSPTVEPPPSISLLDAYKVLRVPLNSAWEAIEQSRRQIVQRANPANLANLSEEKRAALRIEAENANRAYKTILQSKIV
jgi:hypothetical protein